MIETLKRYKLQIIILLLIVISIPITLIQLSRQQEIRSRAGGGAPISLILSPLTSTQQLGKQFDVALTVNTGTNNVTSLDITITYDSRILTLVSFTPASTFSTITNDSSTRGTLHYVGVNPTSSPITGASVSIGVLKFQGVTAGTASVVFSNIQATAQGQSGLLPIDTANTKNGSYTITTSTTGLSITGHVFIDDGGGNLDYAGNGKQDPGESGINNVTVTLSTGTTRTTDADGYYSFQNLAANTYTVSITIPSGYSKSPGDTSSKSVTISQTSPNGTADFGIVPLKNPPCYIINPVANQLGINPGTRGYGDLTGDGKVSADDALKVLRFVAGIDNFTPELIEAGDVTGTPNTISTRADVDAVDALYILRFIAGLPIPGTSSTIGFPVCPAITPTPTSTGSCTVATVHGRVFIDSNDNRIYDSTERGFTSINLSGGTTDTARVNMWVNDPTGLAQNINLGSGNGLYEFNNLNSNLSYWLRFTAPSGYRITTQPTAPMQTNLPYQRTRTANLLYQIDYPNTIKFPPCDQTYDFGITNVPANIKGTVFIDDGRGGGIARNGIKDGGEIGYAGATVRIPVGVPGTTVTTNSSGEYIFSNVDTLSTYQTVYLILPSGYELTTPQGVNAFPSSVDSLANGTTGNIVNFGIALIPIPQCTSGRTCTACTAPLNTCNGSGTQDCTLTTTSSGSTNCQQVTQYGLSCTGAPPNCTNGNVCVNNACVVPTGVPTATTVPTSPPNATPVPTIPRGNTVFALNIGLDGIGSVGDNSNPTNSSGSNKNPLRQSRNITIQVFNSNETEIANKSGTLTYQAAGGRFTGNVDMGTLASGNYIVKIKSPAYLRRRIPGIQNVVSGQSYELPAANLVAGDINGDNAINILDYNILISCSIFSKDGQTVCNQNPNYKTLADLDDNGAVNQFDYNLFVRELSVQNGD